MTEKIHCLETPRFMTPEAIAAMQKQFALHWQVHWAQNPFNPKMRQCILRRMPACPLYRKP